MENCQSKPHFQKGDKSEILNYRPISNLCCTSKIFEKLILISKLVIYLDSGIFFGPFLFTKMYQIVQKIKHTNLLATFCFFTLSKSLVM